MCDVINRNNGSRHTFRFHGEGLKYFGICLVNFLLSIVTLGIFVPWAMVRSRRYIYQNMELMGYALVTMPPAARCWRAGCCFLSCTQSLLSS